VIAEPRLVIARFMDKAADSRAAVRVDSGVHRNAFGLFGDALRERPVRTPLGLGVEYAMFAAGLGLAVGLFATRIPLRVLDGALGLRTRERFIDLLARISPG
jgi:hypothetical protein